MCCATSDANRMMLGQESRMRWTACACKPLHRTVCSLLYALYAQRCAGVPVTLGRPARRKTWALSATRVWTRTLVASEISHARVQRTLSLQPAMADVSSALPVFYYYLFPRERLSFFRRHHTAGGSTAPASQVHSPYRPGCYQFTSHLCRDVLTAFTCRQASASL